MSGRVGEHLGYARITSAIAACLTMLATGCATTSVGQVQEVAQDTYSIGISLKRHGLGVTSEEKKAMDDAIAKAGDYCHAKQRTLSITPTSSPTTVTFRCLAQGSSG
jgi:hypothetical protein